ncbi:hypothetical protein VNO78_31197 [Psophocarpus tetragonolobus]|uniref:Uncharacterized protein n=1 Tax=Psophocarpus tetragonolobus TaxID=3891 RepID=A0AAN9RY82_PSOTE
MYKGDKERRNQKENFQQNKEAYEGKVRRKGNINVPFIKANSYAEAIKNSMGHVKTANSYISSSCSKNISCNEEDDEVELEEVGQQFGDEIQGVVHEGEKEATINSILNLKVKCSCVGAEQTCNIDVEIKGSVAKLSPKWNSKTYWWSVRRRRVKQKELKRFMQGWSVHGNQHIYMQESNSSFHQRCDVPYHESASTFSLGRHFCNEKLNLSIEDQHIYVQ